MLILAIFKTQLGRPGHNVRNWFAMMSQYLFVDPASLWPNLSAFSEFLLHYLIIGAV